MLVDDVSAWRSQKASMLERISNRRVAQLCGAAPRLLGME
jgi:hypothetical protein